MKFKRERRGEPRDYTREPVMHRRTLGGVLCNTRGTTKATTIDSAVTCRICAHAAQHWTKRPAQIPSEAK